MPTPSTPTGSPSRTKGTVTAADAISLTDENAKWYKNQWKGDTIEAVSDGHKTRATITGNSENKLEVEEWSDGIPESNSTYTIIGNTVSSTITPFDITGATIAFHDEVPRHFDGILEHENGWSWDPIAQQYSHNGTLLADDDLKALALLLILAVSDDMEAEAARMSTGAIPIGEWQEWQAQRVKELYIALGALGAGGIDRLTPQMLDAIKGKPNAAPGLDYSLTRLETFAQDIASGEMATVEGIKDRAGMYADAGNGIIETVRRESHRNATDAQGRPLFLFERNNLTPGDSCTDGDGLPGCVEQTARGWVPIGDLVPIGSRHCCQNCRCWLSYSLTGLEE